MFLMGESPLESSTRGWAGEWVGGKVGKLLVWSQPFVMPSGDLQGGDANTCHLYVD